jgi:hypothetical protein
MLFSEYLHGFFFFGNRKAKAKTTQSQICVKLKAVFLLLAILFLASLLKHFFLLCN